MLFVLVKKLTIGGEKSVKNCEQDHFATESLEWKKPSNKYDHIGMLQGMYLYAKWHNSE